MDLMSNKAIVIAVGIFVTLMIASGVLMVMDSIRVVYQDVYSTNISLSSQFNEYDAYDNTKKTKLDILNTAKKYRENAAVVVKLNETVINNQTWINNFKSSNFSNGDQTTPNSPFTATVDKKSNPIVITFKPG